MTNKDIPEVSNFNPDTPNIKQTKKSENREIEHYSRRMGSQ